jgi:hypothetical protein
MAVQEIQRQQSIMGQATVKGMWDGFSREVKNDDVYTPVQQFFQDKSNRLNTVTVSALQGLDVAYANPVGNNGFLKATNQVSVAAMKGCVIVGAVLAQGVLDVGKIGSELPQIMNNTASGVDSWKAGDYKHAMNLFGNALGGVAREATRGSVVFGFAKAAITAASNGVAREAIPSLVRKELPMLNGQYQSAFEGAARMRTFKAGDMAYRVPQGGELLSNPGRWFSTRETVTKIGTESQLNIKVYGSPVETMRAYRFKTDVTVYYGKVKDGTGYQLYIPSDVKPSDIFEFVTERGLK